MAAHIFGIRHHGPGCSRSLCSALETLKPDCILIEGPPEGDKLIEYVGTELLKPPVAILVYPIENPSDGVFYPFATFSPEWQSLLYARKKNVAVRFMDLPLEFRFKLTKEELDVKVEDADETSPMENIRHDPIGVLAQAAGYTDRELWWEHQIEQRLDPVGLFDGIMEAMTALRKQSKLPENIEALRESHMRLSIRAAEKQGFKRIAVVCGAWHAPVLMDRETTHEEDSQFLKNLERTKTQATWVPWSYDRLSYRSGYGAGVDSPGWYAHLWQFQERAGIRWATRAARLLRNEDLDASSASVIETVRLAECLAALRNIPLPGLAEHRESIMTVLCHGDSTPLRLIHQKLEVGTDLGQVPPTVPSVPLQRDLEGQQKSLRMKVTSEIIKLDLDLRNATDLSRSRLLHRLNILSIPWGKFISTGGRTSTFHENWQTQWQVDFAVSIVEASIWGNTVEEAAISRVKKRAEDASKLSDLTAILNEVILADLPDCVEHVLSRLCNLAALATDVTHLSDALPALTQITRYGDVRGTQSGDLMPIITGLLERILIGLPGACGSLDDEAATAMVQSIGHLQNSLSILQLTEYQDQWNTVLTRMMDQETIHGLVRGWCCRVLLDQRVMNENELYRRTRLALSLALPLLQAAHWIEGLLKGSGMVLIHMESVWIALDQWVRELSPESFTELLPILRRAFSDFEPPERRMMGEKVRKLDKMAEVAGKDVEDSLSTAELDPERMAKVYPVLAHIIGLKWPD